MVCPVPLQCLRDKRSMVYITMTRQQSLLPTTSTCNYEGVTDAFRKISKYEGIFRTVRGLNVVAVGAGPAHAMYFSTYEVCKRKFSQIIHSKPGQSSVANATAGSLATVVHDAVMNPVEVVKQRLQMKCSPYKGVVDCVTAVYKTEGVTAFYRSYYTQLMMNVPFQVIHFTFYELFQEILNPTREYNPWTHSVSGGIAGGMAAALTTPLDVCKTVLNTQEQCVSCNLYSGPLTVPGFFNAVRRIYEVKGIAGFASGLKARVIFQIPATALTWSVYEFVKNFVVHRDDSNQYQNTDTLHV